ncbi:MAG: electron transport complex subunit RsxC, partial [Clostridia bacterium]|nr:electron transport complex subunit RsxC [Clostridia bacterium]
MLQEKDILIKPVCRAKGGIHPPHNKKSANCATKKIPLASEIFIPMIQHIGAPCKALVQAGDRVTIGQIIGDCDKPVSAPIHASVSGVVKEVKPLACYNGQLVETVVIIPDEEQTDCPDLKPVKVETARDLIQAARACGLVGLGGAGFPSHIKLTPNENTPIDTFLINAAECEPHITSDYRACMEDS